MKNQIMLSSIVLIIIVILVLAYQSNDLKRTYINQAITGLNRLESTQRQIITENDIKHLPLIIQKYLKYAGVIGRETVHNVRIVAEGKFLLDPKRGWSDLRIEQYNFFDDLPMRLSYMKLNILGIPLYGLDTYADGKGSMRGKLAGLLTVIQGKGSEMDTSEQVVLLSEMFTTPATLIDRRITWEDIDSTTVKAIFTDNGRRVSGLIRFNENGELTEFITEDKAYQDKDNTYKKVSWSVLLKDYKDFNGLILSTYSEVIWHFPEGDQCYGKVSMKEIEYNLKQFR